MASYSSLVCVFATDVYFVKDFGAKGDGTTDDTAAFQKTLDEAGKNGGGVVSVPKGNFFFAGHLTVPNAVTLKGIWESIPSHVGVRNRGMPKPTDDGTTLLVTEGAGTEEGAPFITLNHNSTLKGVVLYYPEQDPAAEPQPKRGMQRNQNQDRVKAIHSVRALTKVREQRRRCELEQ